MAGSLRRLSTLVTGLAAVVLLAALAWQAVLEHYGGDWSRAPEDAAWVLPADAQALIDKRFEGLDGPVIDDRVDVLSRGQLSGANFDNRSRYGIGFWANPLVWLRQRLTEAAAGIRDPAHGDGEYVSRLLRQIRAMPHAYRARLFARDAVYDGQGQRQAHEGDTVVDNRYVAWLARRAGKTLLPVVSVHPDRPHAPRILRHWARAGIRHVSWLPVVQRIDLDSGAARAAYTVMARQHMTLHLPVGQRGAPGGPRGWIDPAELKSALDAGVRIDVRLAGARGDHGQRLMPGVLALLADPAYRKRLSIDLSGLLASDRLASELLPLLQHPQFFDRLHYASGYPHSARARAIDVGQLVDQGFIDAADVASLRAIRAINPLLFILVTWRCIHLPATDLRLPNDVFVDDPSA